MAKLKMRVRFDYAGKAKSGKIFFGGKNIEQIAEEVRQHKVALIRNVPLQGIQIEDIDMSIEIYSIYDEITGKPVAYAPVQISFYADTIEDVVKFIINEEFRTIQMLEPNEMVLTSIEVERLLFKVGEEFNSYKDYLERKIDNWK